MEGWYWQGRTEVLGEEPVRATHYTRPKSSVLVLFITADRTENKHGYYKTHSILFPKCTLSSDVLNTAVQFSAVIEIPIAKNFLQILRKTFNINRSVTYLYKFHDRSLTF